MTPLMVVFYALMAVWLLIAAGRRTYITLTAGQDVDPITLLSGAIGILALLVLIPAWEQHRRGRP